MYTLYMLHFGYYLDFESDNLEEAMQKAVDTGYDVSVCKDGSIVKVYHTIGGWR